MPKQTIGALRTALRLGLALTLLALPFELTGGLAVGPLMLTNLELLLLSTSGLWLALLAAERRTPAVPPWLVLGAAAFVGVLLLSALLAPVERGGAIKFALRQAQGALLALCLADTLVRRRAETHPLSALLTRTLLLGAGLSAALGLAELSEAPAVMAVLAPFKTETSYMGGLLRLSASFSYANTAAQFYEALLPLAVLTASSLSGAQRGAGERWRPIVLLAPALPALLLLATLFTYSRTALLVSALLLLVTPGAAWWQLGRPVGLRTAALSAGLAAVGLALVVASPTFRVRITEPDVANWYSARYTAPRLAPMAPNELRSVPIALVNNGRIRWEPEGPRPVRLAYHWLDAETGRIVRFEGRRTGLPHPVEPGASVTLQATVQAPSAPGRYVLAWDMLREQIGRGWFSQMGVPPARVSVAVGGAPAANVPPPPPDGPASVATIAPQPGPPGRSLLWGVALELWRERPLIGIGPDVFRHVYGERLGLARFDRRVHANSLYLELLAGAGVLGLGALLALVGACLWRGARAVAGSVTLGPDDRRLLLGALLGLAALLAHGLLDVFLAFTPTYALLWLLLGVVAGLTATARNRNGPPAT